MQFGIPSARLPILSGVSTRLTAEFERYALRMASCSGLLRFGWSTIMVNRRNAPTAFVVRNFAVSVIALSASGEEPSCGKPVFIRLYRKSLWITRLPDGCF